MIAPHDPSLTGFTGASPTDHEETTDLALSVHDLLRHYAERRRADRDFIRGIAGSAGDVTTLFLEGLALRLEPLDTAERERFLLRALVDMAWLDLELGVRALPALFSRLGAAEAAALGVTGVRLVRSLDHGDRPAAWERAPDVALGLLGGGAPTTEDATEDTARAVRLARLLGLLVHASDEALREALALVEDRPTRGLLRALVQDEVAVAEERWLAALVLQSGSIGLAVGTASLTHAPSRTLTRIRDLLCVAPTDALVRIAEAHGLLSLCSDGGTDTAEMLRTAYLTQAWLATPLTGHGLHRAFRGELIVAKTLPELGPAAESLARDACTGIPQLIGATGSDDALADPVRRDAMATCLARVMLADSSYCASLRITESRLAELNRAGDASTLASGLRGYAILLVTTARLLLGDERGRDAALRLYARVLRLRQQHTELLPRHLFPDTLDAAIHVTDPERAARRWLMREQGHALPAERTPVQDTSRARTETFAVATTQMGAALPEPLAGWAGAPRSWPARIASWLLPLPVRYLAETLMRWLGFGPAADLAVTGDGVTRITVTRRFFGLPVYRSFAGVRTVLPLEAGASAADRMLGRWSAVLLVCLTVGAFALLRGQADGVRSLELGGGIAIGGGLLGYFVALRLHRLVVRGRAVAIVDDQGRTTLWRLSADAQALVGGANETIPPGELTIGAP